MDINKRFEVIINSVYKGNQSAFAKAVGVTPTVIANVVGTRQGKPSFDVISKICANANISADWLLTGKGAMLKTTQQEHMIVEPVRSNSPNKGAPYYDVDFLGGFDLTFNEQTINPKYNIDFKPFNKPGVTWVNITGHSMEPKINHGDIIALKECRLEDVQYGEIYAVVLDTIRTVKILRKAKDPNRMRYVPINEENYDEQEYDNSRILRIFEVLGNISRFM